MTTHTEPSRVSRPKSKLLLGVLAAASLAMGGLTAGPASAQPPAPEPKEAGAMATGTSEHATGVDTPAEARAVEKYHEKDPPLAGAADHDQWLPTSDPAALGTATPTGPEPGPVPSTAGSVPPASATGLVTAAEWARELPKEAAKEVRKAFPANLPLARTVGRVWYTNPRDGKTYGCSAASLNSPSKMMVATAGHCVAIGGSGAGGSDPSKRVWMKNWMFMPAYNTAGQEAPYGKFVAKYFRTFDYWLDGGALPYDFALVTVNPNAQGQQVVNAVGGNGLSYNYGDTEDVTMVGYPVNHGAGYTQNHYAGRTKTSDRDSALIMMEGSGFNEGGSGGPWLRKYDPLTGKGFINGVTSVIRNGTSNKNDSPHFDGGMKLMWDEQGSRV